MCRYIEAVAIGSRRLKARQTTTNGNHVRHFFNKICKLYKNGTKKTG
jgi:hypothetical protein